MRTSTLFAALLLSTVVGCNQEGDEKTKVDDTAFPQVAYVTFQYKPNGVVQPCPPGAHCEFTIRMTEPWQIRQAIAASRGQSLQVIPMGKVLLGAADYNVNEEGKPYSWHFHERASVTIRAPEWCKAAPDTVENMVAAGKFQEDVFCFWEWAPKSVRLEDGTVVSTTPEGPLDCEEILDQADCTVPGCEPAWAPKTLDANPYTCGSWQFQPAPTCPAAGDLDFGCVPVVSRWR